MIVVTSLCVLVLVVVAVDDILLPIRFPGTLRGIFGRVTSLGGWLIRGAQEEEEEYATTTTTKTNTTTLRSRL